MTKPGETITIRGSVLEETEDRLICEAEAINHAGEVKVKSSFEIKKR